MNILITGGASGLGLAITRLLAKDAGNTIYITWSKSAAVAEELQAQHTNIVSFQCDFTNVESVKSFCNKIKNIDPDVLINNAYAGAYLQKHFQKTATEDYLLSFKENVLPVLEITQAALEIFRNKKNGKIITVLTSALHGKPAIGSSMYAANKAYLQMMVKVWANENAKFNISSNSISPSFMLTNLTASIDERIVEQIIETQSVKSLLTVEEVAETVRYMILHPMENGTDIEVKPGSGIR
ncbi:MAG: SDR family oxidoreductase [Bacteroidota bacterium]